LTVENAGLLDDGQQSK